MAVVIIEDPPKDMRPEKAIRADVAWKLFLPDHMGDIPAIGKGKIEPIRHWLWWELSRKIRRVTHLFSFISLALLIVIVALATSLQFF